MFDHLKGKCSSVFRKRYQYWNQNALLWTTGEGFRFWQKRDIDSDKRDIDRGLEFLWAIWFLKDLDSDKNVIQFSEDLL